MFRNSCSITFHSWLPGQGDLEESSNIEVVVLVKKTSPWASFTAIPGPEEPISISESDSNSSIVKLAAFEDGPCYMHITDDFTIPQFHS
ncbi:hypothetical protein WG66_012565 [Moniliophthora roreri]|nr:hypothetical protein WG66_012565 [Moniliophthora roreri]